METMLLILILLFCFHLASVCCSAGRTEVRVMVPPVVRRGSTVTLVCLHNLTADNLYSVKWYRGNYEFYRFLPKERPPATTFPLPGLEVDMNGSSGQQVTIRVLTRHISGVFTCEVSAEEPFFSTSSDSANLTVIDIGLRKPLVIPSSSVHVAGLPIQVNCSAQPTVPAPNISFYLDDVKVNKSAVRVLAPGLAVLEVDKLGSSEGPVCYLRSLNYPCCLTGQQECSESVSAGSGCAGGGQARVK
ncbi:uncharacterized protein LOC128994934 isoform X1 [Macrosteles quadrilineatus]|uniref:uncharacterized protein LOC128994934 isoform X1 n=1 Tax=Macrosteles quadrilineatus TaxID=74068 RepID=UPI0023E0CBCB|nr:uncharacterized protein LOC128994934 isoform X1 [Macrosteles quadrilineatus]